MNQKHSTSDEFLFIIAILLFIASCLIYLYSSIVAYNQIYIWLKSGLYIDTSLYACFTPNKWTGIGPLSYVPVDWTKTNLSAWLISPSNWIGIHKIVVPLFKSVSIYAIGYIVGFLLTVIQSKLMDITEKPS